MSQTPRSDDSLLEERIEKIRKNNERIQRRYLEVEADKQNAAKLNALVQLSPPPEDEEPRFSHPRLPKKSERDVREQGPEDEISYSPRTSAREHRFGASTQPFTSTKSHSFSQDDGPPPDPVYNFLADRQRDPRVNSRGAPFQRGGRGNRGSPTQYRERMGPSETRGKFSRGRGRGSEGPHQHAYEMWKSERHQIDQERINRQKTAGGEWKREWDKEKVSEDVDNDWPPSAGEGRTPYRRDRHTLESYLHRDAGHHIGANHPETNRDGKGITRKKKPHDAASPFISQDMKVPPKSPKPERRIVKDLGTSLQVSVKNDHAAAPPLQRVKVSPKNIAGTGRVGPRQQARMSYSSQSEDETVHRVNIERKVPTKRQNKKYEQFPETKPHSGTSTPSSKEKGVIHGASEANVTGASKPPLPPASDSKTGNEMPKPKRQILKAVRQRGLRNSANKSYGSKSSDSDKKESSDDAKERSESGDDGWEDVTTTSGTESMSEDAAPSKMENNSCEVALNDLHLTDTKEASEVIHISESQTNSRSTVMPSEGTAETERKASDVNNSHCSTTDQSATEKCGNTACNSNDGSAVDTEILSAINNLSSVTIDQSAAESCGKATHDSDGHSAVDHETLHGSGSSHGENKQEELLNSPTVEIQQNETGNPNCTDSITTAVEIKDADLASPQQCRKESDVAGDGKMDEK